MHKKSRLFKTFFSVYNKLQGSHEPYNSTAVATGQLYASVACFFASSSSLDARINLEADKRTHIMALLGIEAKSSERPSHVYQYTLNIIHLYVDINVCSLRRAFNS